MNVFLYVWVVVHGAPAQWVEMPKPIVNMESCVAIGHDLSKYGWQCSDNDNDPPKWVPKDAPR